MVKSYKMLILKFSNNNSNCLKKYPNSLFSNVFSVVLNNLSE